MTMSRFDTYFLMKTPDVLEYVKEKGYLPADAELTAKEIGDGYLNYVYRVVDAKTGKSERISSRSRAAAASQKQASGPPMLASPVAAARATSRSSDKAISFNIRMSDGEDRPCIHARTSWRTAGPAPEFKCAAMAAVALTPRMARSVSKIATRSAPSPSVDKAFRSQMATAGESPLSKTFR